MKPFQLSFSVFSLMMGILLTTVISLLGLRAYSVVSQFEQYQIDLAQKQARVTAKGIENLLDSIRQRMVAVALDEFFEVNLHEF